MPSRTLQVATSFVEHVRAIYDKAGSGCQPLASASIAWCTPDGTALSGDATASVSIAATPISGNGVYTLSGTTPTTPGDYYLLGKGQDDTGREVYFESGAFSITPSGVPGEEGAAAAVTAALIAAGVLQYVSGSSGPLQLTATALAQQPQNVVNISSTDTVESTFPSNPSPCDGRQVYG